MAVSENDKIVSDIWANRAKVNKDQKTRRIKVKKEKKKTKTKFSAYKPHRNTPS